MSDSKEKPKAVFCTNVQLPPGVHDFEPSDSYRDAFGAGFGEDPEPEQRVLVPVGGRPPASMEHPPNEEDGWTRHGGAEEWRNYPKPVVDRRRGARPVHHRMPLADLVVGTALSLISLIVIGYLVHVYL